MNVSNRCVPNQSSGHLRQVWPAAKHSATALLVLLLTLALVAGAAAQTGRPDVAITRIDSQAFPQVTTYLTVTGQNGLPITGLTLDDFLIVTDGVQVKARDITLEPVKISGRHLVLALDASAPDETLSRIKRAAKALAGDLAPEDRLAVIAFHDNVAILTDFTNNTQTLQAAIDSISGQGNYTALHQAIFEGAALLEGFAAGGKALIVLTDSKNNTGPVSPEQATTQVRQAGATLYLIELKTEKIGPTFLEALAAQTIGQTTIVDPDQIEVTLQAAAEQLPQGYRLTFQSNLAADDREHDLAVSVTNGQRTGQAQGRFVAVTGTLTVDLPEIRAGQTVGGLVPLRAAVEAPAAEASVSYLIDGELLAELSTPPYEFAWDSSTVEPGPHILTVQAVDRVGNEGRVEVSLTVTAPVQVSISTPRSEVALGDPVMLRANIVAWHALAKVDLLLDGRLVASDTTPPYTFSFDSGQSAVGRHRLTMRAEDILGQSGEAGLSIEFLPAWSERLRLWLGFEERTAFEAWLASVRQVSIAAVAGLAGLALIFATIKLLSRIRARQAAFTWQTYGLAILNLGNTRSRYELWAEDAVGTLNFGFTLNGSNLQEQQVPVTEIVKFEERAERAPEVETGDIAFDEGLDPPSAGTEVFDPSLSGQQLGQAAGKARRALGASNTIGTMLNGVAKILPRPLARPLQNVSNQLRMQRTRIQHTMRVPTQVAKTARTVKRQAGSITPTLQKSASGPAPAATASADPPPLAAAAQPVRPALAANGVNGRVKVETMTQTVTVHLDRAQTPFVEPGETLVVDLLIKPLDPDKSQDYAFKVFSRPLTEPAAAPMIEKGLVQITRLPWWRRLLPIFGVMLVAFWLMLALAGLAAWLLGFDIIGFYLQELSQFWLTAGPANCHFAAILTA